MTNESPKFMRTSLAAAMTLDFMKGWFYRNATSPCINLLLTYDDGCAGSCAYCGLSRKREGAYDEKSFIRVGWSKYSLEDMMVRISASGKKVKRVCISMVTNKRAINDTSDVIKSIREVLDVPVSILLAPTILNREILQMYKDEGVDMVGIAIDCVTPEIFEKYRGRGVGGPHHWDTYWQCLDDSLKIFGNDNAGAHLIVGMGETEKEMIDCIQRIRDLGGYTHLFSFFPEKESLLADRQPPPMGQYRRVQLARYIIDNDLARTDNFEFNDSGQIMVFGPEENEIDRIISSGKPFRTSGCPGKDGIVACNRPFANSVPGPNIRNYPFDPNEEDINMIRGQIINFE